MGARVERLLEVHKAHIEWLLVLTCLIHQYSEIRDLISCPPALSESSPVCVQFPFQSSLRSFPVWSEEGSCLHGRQEQLFCHLHIGKWNKCGECPFLWPLTSFPDRRTYMYSVHSVQYCLSSCYEEFYETLHLKRLALGEWHWKSLHVTRIVAIWQAMRYFLFVVCKEVTAALKKLNKHKAPGLSGLVAEMIQATGDIRTQWILVLCNGILKEGAFQRIGSQVL